MSEAIPRHGNRDRAGHRSQRSPHLHPGRPRVVFTPGHTYGHCALHLPDRDVLLTGDAHSEILEASIATLLSTREQIADLLAVPEAEAVDALTEVVRPPSPEEIALELQWTAREVKDILRIAQLPVSLEKPIGEEEDSELGDFVEDDASESPYEMAVENLRAAGYALAWVMSEDYGPRTGLRLLGGVPLLVHLPNKDWVSQSDAARLAAAGTKVLMTIGFFGLVLLTPASPSQNRALT